MVAVARGRLDPGDGLLCRQRCPALPRPLRRVVNRGDCERHRVSRVYDEWPRAKVAEVADEVVATATETSPGDGGKAEGGEGSWGT